MSYDLELSGLLELDRVGFRPDLIRRDLVTFYGSKKTHIIQYNIIFADLGDNRVAHLIKSKDDFYHDALEWLDVDSYRTLLRVDLLLGGSEGELRYSIHELRFFGKLSSFHLSKSIDDYGLEFFELNRVPN